MKKQKLAGIAILVLGAALVLGFISLDEEKMAPTTALDKFNVDFRAAMKEKKIKTFEEYVSLRKEVAVSILPTVQTENLSDEERLALCDLLDYAGKTDEATAIAKDVMGSTGLTAQKGAIKYIGILSNLESYDEMESAIADYRSRFKPSPELLGNLSGPVSSLARHYQENGEHEKAVQTVMAEISTLDDSAPYFSYMLLGNMSESFIQIGKKAQLMELCKNIGEKFAAVAEERGKDPNAKDKDFALKTRQYSGIGNTLSNVNTRLTLIGEQAPDFTLSHFFNSDPVTLKDLKGKVVMIDFWANWCGPCKAAFPHMRKLYDQYKDQGFVILSVTSFQGSFNDGDISEREIDQERELALTADFVKNHEMTWPVAFSDRSCFDPKYGVSGIPTFALIGRDGMVKHIGVGSGEETEKSLNEWVPKLLAEEE